MKVRPGLGVVPELDVVERDFPQQPASREFVEGVVDRAERRSEADRPCFLTDRFRGEVAVATAEYCAGEIEPLAGRPHPGAVELTSKIIVMCRLQRSASWCPSESQLSASKLLDNLPA